MQLPARRPALAVAALAAGAVLVAGCTGSPPPAPAASPSSPSGSASVRVAEPRTDPSALARIRRVPVPRLGTPTAASLGDPLFPGLGNGGYDVQRYDLRLTYPRKDPGQRVRGGVTVTARATQDLPLFHLDFSGGGITRVTVDGAAARWQRRGAELVVTPAVPVRGGRVFTTVVEGFTAQPVAAPQDEQGRAALLRSADGTGLAGQPAAMRTFFPCNDHPADKAAFTVTVDVPQGWTAAASGTGDVGSTRAGRTVWRYRHDGPMATELLQVVVGDYEVVERAPVDGVRLRDVLPRSLSRDERAVFERQDDQLPWLTARLGPYPFEVYGRTTVAADFSSLETQTLTIVPRTLLAEPPGRIGQELMHELAHQWFGNSVSPAQWSDVWLSEGHATWYQMLYGAERGTLGATFAGEDLDTAMRILYGLGNSYRSWFGPPAAPRESRTLRDLFNPNVYVGGALTLYALRQEVGVPAFEEIQRRWVEERRGGVASTGDFVALASRVAGRDLGPFLDAWLYGGTSPPMPGHPDWVAG